jgi:hypothetical protein
VGQQHRVTTRHTLTVRSSELVKTRHDGAPDPQWRSVMGRWWSDHVCTGTGSSRTEVSSRLRYMSEWRVTITEHEDSGQNKPREVPDAHRGIVAARDNIFAVTREPDHGDLLVVRIGDTAQQAAVTYLPW